MGTALLLAAPAFAQLNVEDEIELTRSYIEANRKTIVAVNINFTDEESKIFWPVYKDYRTGAKEAGNRLALIPLVIAGHEPGNEIQSPMGQVILGGLLTSTIFNMLLVPVLFAKWGHTDAS